MTSEESAPDLLLGPVAASRRELGFTLIFVLALLLWAPFLVIRMFITPPLSIGLGNTLTGFLLTFAPALPIACLIFLLDRNGRLRPLLVLTAFIWGGLIATGASVVFSTLLDDLLTVGPEAVDLLSAVYVAPLVEETTKGLVLLLFFVCLRWRFTTALDGLIYGALVGLGFAIFENYLYFLGIVGRTAVLGTGIANIVTRTIFTIGGHPIYTGLCGLGFGLAREKAPRWWRFGFIPMGWLGGMALHSFWNTLCTVIEKIPYRDPAVGPLVGWYSIQLSLMFVAFSVVFYLLAAWLAARREQTLVLLYLVEEGAADVVTADELAGFKNTWDRCRLGARSFFTEGLVAWYRRRRLRRAQVHLAIRRWRIEVGEVRLAGPDPVADALRRRILALRAELAGRPVPPERPRPWLVRLSAGGCLLLAVAAAAAPVVLLLSARFSGRSITRIADARAVFIRQRAAREADQGRHRAALALLTPEAADPDWSPGWRASWYRRMAENHLALEEFDTAAECLRRSIVFGLASDEEGDTIRALREERTLGGVCLTQARYREALACFVEVAARAPAGKDDQYSLRVDSHRQLAQLYRELARFDPAYTAAARTYADSAVALAIAQTGWRSYLAGRMYLELGALELQQGDYDRALLHIAGAEYGLGLTATDGNHAYRLLGELAERRGDTVIMREAYAKVGSYADRQATVISWLGQARADLLDGETAAALGKVSDAEARCREGDGALFSSLADVHRTYGRIFTELKQDTEALAHHREALHCDTLTYGETHPRVTDDYQALADCFRRTGDRPAAAAARDRADRIRAELRDAWPPPAPRAAAIPREE